MPSLVVLRIVDLAIKITNLLMLALNNALAVLFRSELLNTNAADYVL